MVKKPKKKPAKKVTKKKIAKRKPVKKYKNPTSLISDSKINQLAETPGVDGDYVLRYLTQNKNYIEKYLINDDNKRNDYVNDGFWNIHYNSDLNQKTKDVIKEGLRLLKKRKRFDDGESQLEKWHNDAFYNLPSRKKNWF
jgi:hypothetical protein